MQDKLITTLETKRLTLKPLGLDFLSKTYLGWMQDDQVVIHLESGGTDYTFKMLENYLMKIEKNKIFSWAIILKNTNHHIGNIKIDPIDFRNLIGEYGIMIGDKTSWGKGYAREASIEVINFCFKKLLLKKINLGLIANNKKALSLYKSLGFIVKKRFKKHLLLHDAYTDNIRMGLFNDHYNE